MTRTTGYMALSAHIVVAVRSGTCSCRQSPYGGCSDEWDIDPSTKFARGFFAVLAVLATAAVVVFAWEQHWARRDDNEDMEQRQQTDQGMGAEKERLWHLDYARIICVACVVTEHSGGGVYARRNIVWVQQWVLPYLYAVSGYSFMFSSGSILAYLLRLAVVFLIGVSANWIADAINGRDWKNDFGDTMFQMSYVLVIALASIGCAPLRQALRWRHKNRGESAPLWMLVWTGVAGALTLILLIVGIVFGFSANDDKNSGRHAIGVHALEVWGPYVVAAHLASYFLCMLTCATGCDGRAGWVLMAFMYIHRMTIAYSRGGHPMNVDIFMLGMLVQKVPLYGVATLAQTAREYWPIVFVLFLLLSAPGVTGRCDLHPHYHVAQRIRFYSIEWILMLLLISGAYNTSDSRQITPWLNKWALYAFCFHEAWARIFCKPMYGAVFTYSAIPAFYALHRYLEKCNQERQESKV